MRPISKTIRRAVGAFVNSAAIAAADVLHGCPPLEIEEPILSAPRRAAVPLPHVAKVFRLRSAQHRFVGRVHVTRTIQNAVRGRTNVAPRTYPADFCNTICQWQTWSCRL